MTLAFGSPLALWLLTIVALVWVFRRTAGVSGRRSLPAAIMRSVVLACLALALAQPVVTRPAGRVALVCLVDASHSVSSGALEGAASAIDEIAAALRPDALRILAFGGRVTAIADAAALRRLAVPSEREGLDRLVSAAATNLEQALAAARAEIPPGMSARVVLFTDGHETEGDSHRITERLAADHVPVFTRPLAVRDLQDTWVDAVRVPRGALAESISTIDVLVGSQKVRPVQVTVREAGQVLAQAAIEAGLGVTTASLGVRFAAPGPHLVEAAIVPRGPDGDVLAENNTLAVEVLVEPRPRVLHVHAEPGAVPMAARVLAETGLHVTSALPNELPRTAEAFDPWDVVVLSNLARPLIDAEAMAALAAWVEDRGGGLLFAGGPAIAPDQPDAPDYRRTELERVLPVTFDREEEAEVALVIVLDRSWSMNGAAMDLSKTAAEAAANTLEPAHMVGVLTFSNQATWDVPVSRLRDARPTLHDAIMRIRASGPTDIYLALSQAYDALAGIRARAKHLILLSDGQTEVADFEGLMRKMAEARVTVSSIALGGEADVALLERLASLGGGRSYVVQDAREVPEIFVKEARSAVSPAMGGTDDRRPRAGGPALLGGQVGEFPALEAQNPVTRKPGAIDLLTTSRGEPLLSVWPAGLGRTAMFAADLEGRWTRDWLHWPGFGSFLGTVVRSLAPQKLPARVLQVTPGEHQGARRVLTVTLDARDADGRADSTLTPLIDVRVASAATRRGLLPVGPGRYATRVMIEGGEPLTFTLIEDPSGEITRRIFAPDSAVEYRFRDPDERKLRAIAAATGGRPDATSGDLRDVPRTAATERHPFAPWLLLAALAGWLADVGVRRLTRHAA